MAHLAPLPFVLVIGVTFLSLRGHRLDISRFVLALTLGYVLGLVIGRLFTRQYTLRLSQLRRSAERIERGDYRARLEGSRDPDEFSDLARAFNHMADVIASRESALREQNQVLAALNHRMESVLNATNDGIALLNREGRFSLVNRRFCELLGTRPELLIHQTIGQAEPRLLERMAHSDRLLARFASLTEDDLLDPVGVAEEVIEIHEPDRRFLQLYTAPVPGEDGREVMGRILALRDVTREKELDKMKTEFISVVSHELRTPLTSIKGYSELLLSEAAGEITEIQREFLGIIQTSTTRLTNLINDILDISKIESGRISVKYEPIDYRQIVADVLRLMNAPAAEKQIVMDAALPESMPPVCGDPDKVMQVLTNLVGNAIKYTPEGGWVKVLLDISGDASVTTCVSDSGIGIAPEDQARLFQKFFRADNSSTREAGGTGLGLVIAKTLVEMMGGAIWVESVVGHGSRFFFTLPLYTESRIATAPPEAIPLPDRGIGLVLVVDDDAYVRGLIQHHLHRRGYGTVGAGDESEALTKARQHKPEAITLDIMMPEMSGLRILQLLKRDPATARIPVVIMSVVGDPARGAFSLGAFSFLRKPLDERRLVEIIAASLTSARGELPSGGAGWATVLSIGGLLFEGGDDALAAQGIRLYQTAAAPEAIALTIRESPDIILIDMGMPEESLFELIGALKAEEEAARIPIILMTEDISDEGIHFHLGSDLADNAVSLDYICEQLSRAMTRPTLTRSDAGAG